MEMTAQSSYPRNSENASPPGTLKLYLSCASCAETTVPPRIGSATVAAAIASIALLFIARTPLAVPHLQAKSFRGGALGGKTCNHCARRTDNVVGGRDRRFREGRGGRQLFNCCATPGPTQDDGQRKDRGT